MDKKSARVTISFSQEDNQLIQRLATNDVRTPSNWIYHQIQKILDKKTPPIL